VRYAHSAIGYPDLVVSHLAMIVQHHSYGLPKWRSFITPRSGMSQSGAVLQKSTGTVGLRLWMAIWY
jgi:hypothetical protein